MTLFNKVFQKQALLLVIFLNVNHESTRSSSISKSKELETTLRSRVIVYLPLKGYYKVTILILEKKVQ